MPQDMTVSQVIADPLITALRRADRIPQAAFAQFLESAARVQSRRLESKRATERADAFRRRLDAMAQETLRLQ